MPKISYVAHDREVFEKLASKTCKAIARKKDDPKYRDYEVLMGMAEFLNIVADIRANHLNKQNNVTEADEE